MFAQLFLAFLAFLATASVASAAPDKERVVVLEIPGFHDPAIGAKASELVRESAKAALPSDKYVLMTKETFAMLLEDMGLDATPVQGECEVETGRNIGAAFVISGGMEDIGPGRFLLSLKVHDTASGALKATGDVRGESLESLLKQTPDLTRALIDGWLSPKARTQQPPAKPVASPWVLPVVKDKPGNLPRIAILSISGKAASLAFNEVLTDQVRIAMLDVVPTDQYLLMSRENMVVLLKDMGLEPGHNDGECEVETGRNVGAAFVVSGSLEKLNDWWVATLKMHNTASGTLIGTATVKSKDEVALLSLVKERIRAQVKVSGSPEKDD